MKAFEHVVVEADVLDQGCLFAAIRWNIEGAYYEGLDMACRILVLEKSPADFQGVFTIKC